MATFAYSWMGTDIHLVLDEKVADTFNRAQKAWFDAQMDFVEETHREWNPIEEAIKINWTDEEMFVWNQMGTVINELIKLNGGSLDISEEAMTSDYLVKLES